MKNISILYITLFSIILFTSCKKSGEAEKTEESAAHEEGNPNQIGLTQEQFNTIGIQLGGFENKNLVNTIKANGVLEVPPQNTASVSTYTTGVVKAINVIQGDFVNKGKTLATLEHPDILQLQQDYNKAKSDFDYLELEFQRQKQLMQEDVVAAKKFQQVEAEYKSQKGLVKSMEGRLHLLGISPEAVINGDMVSSIAIKSPINGYINKIEVSVGTSVDPAMKMFEVIDNSYIHADLQVYERDLSQVKVGQKIYFTLANSPGEVFEAAIFSASPSFESNTKSFTVHAEIKGNKRKDLKPGLYVNGRIELGEKTVPALPNEAVVSEGTLKFIFIRIPSVHHEMDKEEHKGEEGKEEKHTEHKGEKEAHEHEEAAYTFQKVEVKTGISDQGYTEVIPMQTLPENAEIVKKGAFYLAAQIKQAQGVGGDEGHGH